MERKVDSWKQAIIGIDSKIEDAIQTLDRASLKIVLVTTPLGVLLGTISDGDVRRGLLRGCQLTSSISEIINSNPISVSPMTPKDVVTKLMLHHEIFQIPIVDEKGGLVGLHIFDDILFRATLSNIFVIMAGGKGTRLLPKTQSIPKPMLEISGRPILEHIILRAREQGFKKIVLVVHYLSEVIEDYFGDGRFLGVEVEYLREKVPLGTAGGLSLFKENPHDSFVVTNGDVITDIRYREILEFHEQNKSIATMAVQRNEWQNPFGVVETKGFELIGYEEKPIVSSLINAGVYVLHPLTLSIIDKETKMNMPTLFEEIRNLGHKVLVYPMHERWTDIGRHDDLERAMNEFNGFEEKK